MDKKKIEEIKEILSSKEALGIICFNKHHHHGRVNCTRLSELLKIPINKLKDTCTKLQELKVLKLYKMGQDIELEITEEENDDIKHIIDEIIWDNKQEYGKIYKKLITAELLDFMGDNK